MVLLRAATSGGADALGLLGLGSENESFLILKQRTLFSSGTKDTSDLFAQVESIKDLQPLEVFNKRLEIEDLDDDRNASLTEAFLELLDLVNEDEAL